MAYGNGARAEYTYWASGAVSKIAHYSKTGVLMASTGYEYDKAGNPTKVRLDDSLQYNGDANVYYEYDNCHRLTRENCVPDAGSSRFAFDYKYQYDAVGNMTRRIQTNPWYTNREERMYYSPRNELTSIQDPYPTGNYWRFEYDMRGNLTKKYHTYYTSSWYTFAWDAQDRLTKVVNNASNKTIEYKYDLYGRRAAKRVDTGSGFGAWRWYFYDGLKVVAEGTGPSDRIYYTNAPSDVGGIICRDQNGTTSHTYHYDRLGNVLAVTNAAGELAAVYESTAFDYALWAFGSSGFNQTIASPQPYHLTTKELDADTGLYYFNARWYDKHVHRFISDDPVVMEYYALAQSSPTSAIDPTGAKTCTPISFTEAGGDYGPASVTGIAYGGWVQTGNQVFLGPVCSAQFRATKAYDILTSTKVTEGTETLLCHSGPPGAFCPEGVDTWIETKVYVCTYTKTVHRYKGPILGPGPTNWQFGTLVAGKRGIDDPACLPWSPPQEPSFKPKVKRSCVGK